MINIIYLFFTFLSLDISLSCRLRCYNAIRVLTETPFNFFYVYVPRHMIYDFNDIIVEISDLFGYISALVEGERKPRLTFSLKGDSLFFIRISNFCLVQDIEKE